MRCIAGCKSYSGNETYHHKDCPRYLESFSERFDNLQAKLAEVEGENEWLKKYAWHRHFCKMFNRQALAKKEDCTCGYFEALKGE